MMATVTTMYCSECGREIAEDSKFCPACGKEQRKHEAPRGFGDESIRNELKKYKRLNKGICLDCGYEGLMGVSEERVMPRWKHTLTVVLMLAAMAFIHLMFGRLVFFVVALPLSLVVWIVIERHYKVCPNCGKRMSQ